jgi:hypothetical protein
MSARAAPRPDPTAVRNALAAKGIGEGGRPPGSPERAGPWGRDDNQPVRQDRSGTAARGRLARTVCERRTAGACRPRSAARRAAPSRGSAGAARSAGSSNLGPRESQQARKPAAHGPPAPPGHSAGLARGSATRPEFPAGQRGRRVPGRRVAGFRGGHRVNSITPSGRTVRSRFPIEKAPPDAAGLFRGPRRPGRTTVRSSADGPAVFFRLPGLRGGRFLFRACDLTS